MVLMVCLSIILYQIRPHRCCFDNFLIDALITYHISGRDITPLEYISYFISSIHNYVIPGI